MQEKNTSIMHNFKARLFKDRVVSFKRMMLAYFSVGLIILSMFGLRYYEKKNEEKCINTCMETLQEMKKQRSELISKLHKLVIKAKKDRDELKVKLDICINNNAVK